MLFQKLPENNELRVFAVIAMCSMEFNKFIDIPLKKRTKLTLRGVDSECLRYLWTALMLIGLSYGKDFSYKTIEVQSEKFIPKSELGWFSHFGAESLHDKVFLPALAGTKVEYCPDEMNREFGHQVPASRAALKTEVQRFLCQMLLDKYFIIKDKTLSVIKPVEFPLVLKEIGATKIAQMFAMLADEIETLELGFAVRSINMDDLIKLLAPFAKNLKSLNLGHNNLERFAGDKEAGSNLTRLFSMFLGLTTVNLNGNKLGKLGQEALSKFVSGLGKDLQYLLLAENDLFVLGEAGLIKLLSTCPSNMTAINLGNNGFSNFTGKQLAAIFRAIQRSVFFVDISDNDLQKIEKDKPLATRNAALALAFSGFQEGLMTLVLQRTEFTIEDRNTLDGLPQVFKNLPKTLAKLYLARSSFGYGGSILLSQVFQYISPAIESPDSEILKLAKQGVKDKEQELKQEQAAKDQSLITAVKKFDVTLQEVKALLNNGSNVNCTTTDTGFTPLMLALDGQNERLAEYLLKNGADPLIKNKNRETARDLISRNALICPILKGYELLFATMKGDLAMATRLLKEDSSIIDFQGEGGYSALLIAAEQNMKEIVAILLFYNPNLSLTRADGLGVFDLAKDKAIQDMLTVANTENNEVLDDDIANDDSTAGNHLYGFFETDASDDNPTLRAEPLPSASSYLPAQNKG